MANQVLIVAPEHAARTPAEIARSLRMTPVVTGSEQEAVELLGRERFRLIAVSGNSAWQRLRDAAESKQPMTRVLELPDLGTDDLTLRRLMTRYLAPVTSADRARFTTEERYRFLSSILEAFTGTLELREVLRRIVSITREELGADRGWLLHPIHEETEFAKIAYTVSSPAHEGDIEDRGPVPLAAAQNVIRRAMESPRPVVLLEGDPDLDPQLAKRFKVRSLLVQILRPREEEPWAFGIHQIDSVREWTEEEISLFTEIGRYATLALNNTLLHNRAVREMAKVNAILDQIPEAAAIYDANGHLERMNVAAQREPAALFAPDAEGRARSRHRHLDGSPLATDELPSMRALRGDAVKADYLVHDPRSGDDRVVNLKAAPIRDQDARIIGSVVLSRDITEERQNAERESWRRRRAGCLANLGLELVAVQPTLDNLDDTAQRIARAVAGTVRIHLYHPGTGQLDLVGFAAVDPLHEQYRQYFESNPYRPGEGLLGTVFHIGRPLLFYEVRGDALLDYSRDEEERAVKAALHEESLVACPIESYGERIGVLVISQSDPRRNFDAEDLEFAQSVAERIGAASHIHRLTRMAQDGHRAAEELARREVDARVRFEAVLESAPIGIAVVSADELRFELANARFIDYAARFGKITPEDTKVVGLRANEVLPASERILKQVAESGETRVDKELHVDNIYVNRIISAARGRFSGITQSLTILVQDVSDQVRSRREIENLAGMMAERSARLDSILGSMTDGLWVYDANGTVVDVNQAALNMFGLASRAEAIQHGSFERFNVRDSEGRIVAMPEMPYARALAGETVPDYLAMGRHLLTGRDLDLSIAAAPIISEGVVGAVLVIRDITAVQELDRKKDEFLSVASHELRTPLTTIKGYTQLLAQTVNDLAPEERSTYIRAVLGEIERMMGLISELLDVSRIETNRLQIHPQPIRWVEFIEGRVSAFRVQHPARTIGFDVATPETMVVADPDRMRQVVDNLLSNAIKYSPEGSNIEVRVTVEEGHTMTAVRDYGIGIPRDEIPQLFERFHRARNVSSRYYGGLGLGLYIARAIIEAHGGVITVQSDEGHGSTFTVQLPLPAA